MLDFISSLKCFLVGQYYAAQKIRIHILNTLQTLLPVLYSCTKNSPITSRQASKNLHITIAVREIPAVVFCVQHIWFTFFWHCEKITS